MTEKENEKAYPVKTIHEFLSEIDRERSKFKRGALISILISSLLLVALILAYVQLSRRGLVDVSDIILAIALISFLAYSIYLMVVQYRFFRKWEKRMTRLVSIEEKLMPEKNENTA